MVDWKKVIRPVSEGTRQLATILVKKSAPPTPSLDEFVSPLQEAVRTEIAIKQDIGYNTTCVNCSQHRAVDERLRTAVDTATDPQPWLKELHGELVKTRTDLALYRNENNVLRLELQAVRSDVNPIKRMLYLFGAGLAGLSAKALWDLWLQQYIINMIPLLLPFIP